MASTNEIMLKFIEDMRQEMRRLGDKVTTLENTIHASNRPSVTQQKDANIVREETKDNKTVGGRKFYDACLVYADDDRSVAMDFINFLEKEKGFRLMVPERDILAGQSEHTVTAELIENNCVRVIVLVSNKFLQCPTSNFQVNFAHCLSSDARDRRLIPVVIDADLDKRCMPAILRPVSMCDFTKEGLQEWHFPRLVDALNKHVDTHPDDVTDPHQLRKTVYVCKSAGSSDHDQGNIEEPSTSYSCFVRNNDVTAENTFPKRDSNQEDHPGHARDQAATDQSPAMETASLPSHFVPNSDAGHRSSPGNLQKLRKRFSKVFKKK